MKIRDDDGMPRGIQPQPRPIEAGRLDSKPQASTSGKPVADRVELSDRARSLHLAQEALSRLPEIRQDRVEALRQMVKAGTYHVPSDKIADRMLGEGLFA